MADMDLAMRIPADKLDPKYKYTWVMDETKTQTVFRMQGYEIVKTQDQDGQALKDDPRASQGDGKIRVGDAILMRVPKEVAEKRDQERRQKLAGRVPAIKEDFHSEVANLGIESFEDDKP